MAELPLARDFPPADEAAWKKLVADALKGAPVSALTSRSYDGIAIDPLYPRAEDAQIIAGRAAGTPWAVMQRLDLPDPEAANAQILEDLNKGASGVVCVFGGAVGDYGYALPHGEAAIARVLQGVHLDWGIDLTLDFGPPSREAARIVVDRVKALGLAPSALKLRFGFDPLGALAVHGALPKPFSEIAPVVAGMIGDLAGQGFAGPFAVADARPVHAAGGSEAQELAFALANAVAYLRALEASGIALDDARRFIFFRLAADQDQFLTVAKFRGIRRLWARIEDACGLVPQPCLVTAETAWRMMTRRDPHGNIVRSTIATLAAAVGGADAIAVLPFSAALGVPDAFARRVARNTQIILIEEANIPRVADPAAGSGAIETLTDQLCAAAWTLFQEIERAGGSAAALEAGLIQKAVAKVRAERQANVARRKESLVGTSDFPALAEDSVAVLATLETSSRAKASGDSSAEPLPRSRLAEPFERLRDASDVYLAKHGARPTVFLACLGRTSDFNARASFAKSLFESGGIEAVNGAGDNLLKEFKDSGAKLACLCSSDKVYASEATSTAKALIQAGAKRVYLAGKPSQDQSALTQAGISTFLHQGCDTLAILEAAYDQI
jgi:methylmalonyl-CoA mutase